MNTLTVPINEGDPLRGSFFINGVLHQGEHDQASLLASLMRVAAGAS